MILVRDRAPPCVALERGTEAAIEALCEHRDRERRRQHGQPVRGHHVCSVSVRLIWPIFCSIGSYAWKAEWGPEYHPSMVIGLASLTLSSLLALGSCGLLLPVHVVSC